MNKSDTRPMKRLKQTLTSGNLWLYILSNIKKKKKIYAYVLDQEIQKKFGFKPGRVMIYLVLYKLQNEGIIESAFEERRKYYTLTRKGEETLLLAKNYLKSLYNLL